MTCWSPRRWAPRRPSLGWFTAAGPESEGKRIASFIPYTAQFNMTGQPAVSLPLHWTPGGLPVGVQLVAGYGREDMLVQVASQLEQAAPWAGAAGARLSRAARLRPAPPTASPLRVILMPNWVHIHEAWAKGGQRSRSRARHELPESARPDPVPPGGHPRTGEPSPAGSDPPPGHPRTGEPSPAGSDPPPGHLPPPGRPPGPQRGRPRRRRSRKAKIAAWIAGILTGVLVIAAIGAYVAYRHLNGNIRQLNISGLVGPQPPDHHPHAENIVIIGSDSRHGQSSRYGNSQDLTTDQSDTLMIAHVPADRQWVDVMSIPRDSWVNIPSCRMGNGQLSSPQVFKINEAFALGNLDGNHTGSASPARSRPSSMTPASISITSSRSTSPDSATWSTPCTACRSAIASRSTTRCPACISQPVITC